MFLDINEDGCAEHPDLCSGKIGEPVYLYTVHGKLNPNLTPHRSIRLLGTRVQSKTQTSLERQRALNKARMGLGACPEVSTVHSLDNAKFAGKWYEIKRDASSNY